MIRFVAAKTAREKTSTTGIASEVRKTGSRPRKGCVSIARVYPAAPHRLRRRKWLSPAWSSVMRTGGSATSTTLRGGPAEVGLPDGHESHGAEQSRIVIDVLDVATESFHGVADGVLVEHPTLPPDHPMEEIILKTVQEPCLHRPTDQPKVSC